jgi:hypothetical protein
MTKRPEREDKHVTPSDVRCIRYTPTTIFYCFLARHSTKCNLTLSCNTIHNTMIYIFLISHSSFLLLTPPIRMEQNVPKRRHIKFIRLGFIQYKNTI